MQGFVSPTLILIAISFRAMVHRLRPSQLHSVTLGKIFNEFKNLNGNRLTDYLIT